MNNRIRLIKLITLKYFKIFQIWKFCIKNHTILTFFYFVLLFIFLQLIHNCLILKSSIFMNLGIRIQSLCKNLALIFRLITIYKKIKKKKKDTKRQFPSWARNSRHILGTQCPTITSVSTHRKPFELTRGSW